MSNYEVPEPIINRPFEGRCAALVYPRRGAAGIDATGAAIVGSSGATPSYFNIWQWILPQLTSAERGGTRANPKPEAILKYAHTPIAMLGGLWEDLAREGRSTRRRMQTHSCHPIMAG